MPPLYKQWAFKLLSTIGVLIHLLLIDIPKDFIRWITLKEKDVHGQLIVITGGASGLGKRMAQILSLEKGARVVILDVNVDGAKETVESIVSGGGEAYAYFCDITKDKELKELAANISQEHGSVDIVVCNAAVLCFALFNDVTVEQLRQSLDVNVLGTVNTIRAFLGTMEKRNSGQIVAVSSIAGFSGDTFGLAYCSTKFAVRGVMECLSTELRDRGINGVVCTTLCPYFSRTPMVLNVGMRPTCMWFPFMSIDSCSRKMVSALLKEEFISFIPSYVTIVPMLKGLLSINCSRSLRDYLGIEYNSNSAMSFRRRTGTSSEYFSSPHFAWWLVTLMPMLLIMAIQFGRILISTESGEWLASVIIPAFLLHLSGSVYTLLLCDELKFRYRKCDVRDAKLISLVLPSVLLRVYPEERVFGIILEFCAPSKPRDYPAHVELSLRMMNELCERIRDSQRLSTLMSMAQQVATRIHERGMTTKGDQAVASCLLSAVSSYIDIACRFPVYLALLTTSRETTEVSCEYLLKRTTEESPP